MRLAVLAAVAVLAAAGAERLEAQQRVPTEPFGIPLGTPLATLRERFGATPGGWLPGWWKLTHVPSPLPPFEGYRVLVSPTRGVCAITAATPRFRSRPDGTEAKSALAAARDSLQAVYGEGELSESVGLFPTLTRPEEWMRSVHSRERYHGALWRESSTALLAGLENVTLQVFAVTPDTAFVDVGVSVAHRGDCIRELREAERRGAARP